MAAGIARPHLEQHRARAVPARDIGHPFERAPAESGALGLTRDAEVEQVRFVEREHHDRVGLQASVRDRAAPSSCIPIAASRQSCRASTERDRSAVRPRPHRRDRARSSARSVPASGRSCALMSPPRSCRANARARRSSVVSATWSRTYSGAASSAATARASMAGVDATRAMSAASARSEGKRRRSRLCGPGLREDRQCISRDGVDSAGKFGQYVRLRPAMVHSLR